MTTTVKIEAHCSNEIEVLINVIDQHGRTNDETFTIQDGESAERFVYDGRVVTVSEITKE